MLLVSIHLYVRFYLFTLVSTMGISPTPQPSLEPLPVITDFVDEFKCNFDSGLCGMSQDVGENADYILNSGPTPNDMTGPSADHTTGEGKLMIS